MILSPRRGWLRNRIGSHGLRRGLHSLSAPRTDLSVVNATGVCISGCTFPGGILGFFTEEWLSLRQPLSLGMNSFAPLGLVAQSHSVPMAYAMGYILASASRTVCQAAVNILCRSSPHTYASLRPLRGLVLQDISRTLKQWTVGRLRREHKQQINWFEERHRRDHSVRVGFPP